MGFLKRSKAAAIEPLCMPTGCFTMDAGGAVVASTMPSDFPRKTLEAVGEALVRTLREADTAGLGLTEFSVHFGSLRLSARDLHGGTLVFINPLDTPGSQSF